MSLRRIVLLVAASAAFAVSGCAGDSAGTPAPSSASAPAPSSVPAPESPTGVPSTAVASGSLSGVVEAGVEPGCLILKSAGRPHVLIFDDPALRSQAKIGASVTVSGTAKPGQMTTCQQGVPFIVTGLRAN